MPLQSLPPLPYSFAARFLSMFLKEAGASEPERIQAGKQAREKKMQKRLI